MSALHFVGPHLHTEHRTYSAHNADRSLQYVIGIDNASKWATIAIVKPETVETVYHRDFSGYVHADFLKNYLQRLADGQVPADEVVAHVNWSLIAEKISA